MENVSVMIEFYQINGFVQKFKKYKETRYEVFLCSGATRKYFPKKVTKSERDNLFVHIAHQHALQI
jgi:hypothetical protein